MLIGLYVGSFNTLTFLSANVKYTPHDCDVTCSGYIALCTSVHNGILYYVFRLSHSNK